jgi:hypothetical protein
VGLSREKREPRSRVEGKIARRKVSNGVGRRGEDILGAPSIVVVEDWGDFGDGAPFRRVGMEFEAIDEIISVSKGKKYRH